MKKSGNQEFVFRTDKNSYQQGEEVLLSGRSLDFNDEIIHEGTVELFYDDEFLGSKPLLFRFRIKMNINRGFGHLSQEKLII